MPEVLHSLLERAARERPGHPAVSDRGRVATYAELDARADALAAALVGAGVEHGDRVGVLLEKSIDAVACLYAVMRTGAAYVPLDPHAPEHRLAQVLADCDVRCVLAAANAPPPAGPGVLDVGSVPPASGAPVRAEVTPDERVAEAIDLVRSKRHGDGRWPLETRYPGTMPVEIDEGEGRPSRWNTLRALRVLRWYERADL